MNNKIFTFGKIIQEWLEQFAPTYRGILPSSQKPADLYLRHDGYFDNFATQFIYPVQIYKLNTTSYGQVVLLADEIESAIGDNGIVIGDDNIRIHIEKGSPFYQDKPDEDETVRAGYINLDISIYSVTAETKYRVVFIDELTNQNSLKWCKAGEVIILPKNKYPYLDDYFYGWNDGENTYLSGEEYTVPAKNVDFRAVWQNLETWTITFVANGETVDIQTYDYIHRKITVPKVPEIYGYIGEWEKFDIFTISGNVIINAIYTPRPEILLSGVFNAENKVVELRRKKN